MRRGTPKLAAHPDREPCGATLAARRKSRVHPLRSAGGACPPAQAARHAAARPSNFHRSPQPENQRSLRCSRTPSNQIAGACLSSNGGPAPIGSSATTSFSGAPFISHRPGFRGLRRRNDGADVTYRPTSPLLQRCPRDARTPVAQRGLMPGLAHLAASIRASVRSPATWRKAVFCPEARSHPDRRVLACGFAEDFLMFGASGRE